MQTLYPYGEMIPGPVGTTLTLGRIAGEAIEGKSWLQTDGRGLPVEVSRWRKVGELGYELLDPLGKVGDAVRSTCSRTSSRLVDQLTHAALDGKDVLGKFNEGKGLAERVVNDLGRP
jgi:hypothetical protein